ncbi:MAG: DUF983 domain-containing protein [Flavobacteriaceae bacterium]|nr:DUF983 domain-containing protein [Flavobacteriaceae bacterium]
MRFLRGSKVYSVFTGACPVCHKESMYVEKNPYKLKYTLRMRSVCCSCKTRYKIEPSFFFGAMYVSYPVGLVFAGTAFILAYWGLGFGLIPSYIAIVLVMVLSLPVILRLSRNIWINFFMRYKSKNNGA